MRWIVPGFVDYRSELRSYERDFPMRQVELSRGPLSCIFAGPGAEHHLAGLSDCPRNTTGGDEAAADGTHTLVFLNGGMNSYEMWLRYVRDLSRDYRVLSFDYPQMYETDQALLEGLHELFGRLSLGRVVLVGASMGGIIAQLYAHRYPKDVEGLCLMSTAGITSGSMRRYGKLLRLLGIEIALMKRLPYSWFLRGERKTCATYVAEASDDAKAYFSDMFDHIFEHYTREKDIHVAVLMEDFRHQVVCAKSDFAFLAGRVLLLLPEDDSAFPPELQQELVSEMTDPIVVPGLKGGHLTTMLHYDDYLKHIRAFLEERL